MSKLSCKYHKNAPLIEDGHAGDMVCSQCGLVVGDRIIDVSSEWRTFTDGDSKDMSRVGAAENELLDGSNLGTLIARIPGTSHSNDSGRGALTNRKQMSSSDRALINAFSEIAKMGARLNLPKAVIDEANKLFKKVYTTKKMRGRTNDTVTAACLYYICRQEKIPRTFKEVCAVCRVSKKEIGKSFKKIMLLLNTSVQGAYGEDFMSRFCSNLSLNMQIQNAAKEIVRKAKSLLPTIGSRSPVSVAAAAIFMAAYAAGNRKEKKEIGETTGVAEATITATYKILRPMAASLFPQNFNFAMPVEDLPQ